MSVCEKVSIIVPVYNTAPYLNDFLIKLRNNRFRIINYILYMTNPMMIH